MRIDWLWLLIGIALALFVFPMLTGWWSSRGSQTETTDGAPPP